MNKAYGQAGSIAQQALASIRTVYAFNGEQRTLDAYAASLDEPVRVGGVDGNEGADPNVCGESQAGVPPLQASLNGCCPLNAFSAPRSPQVGIHQGFLGGLVVGITNGAAFCAYALALWFGSTRILAGTYTGAVGAAACAALWVA